MRFAAARRVEEPQESPNSKAHPILSINYSGVQNAQIINKCNKGIKLYGELLKIYKQRKMTFLDSLNGFSATIEDLSLHYGTQFVWG